MKQNTDEMYAVQSYDIAELASLPFLQQITPSITQYSTNDVRAMSDIVQNASAHDMRVVFHVHDENSNLLVPIGVNVGHTPGFSPDYVLDESGGNIVEFLESFSTQEVGFGEITVDWVLIETIDNWRE